MRIALRRPAVRRPARVADGGVPGDRLCQKTRFEVAELAFRAPPLEVTVLDRRNTGAVIAAVFEPPQRVDEIRRDGLASENADDATHRGSLSLARNGGS